MGNGPARPSSIAERIRDRLVISAVAIWSLLLLSLNPAFQGVSLSTIPSLSSLVPPSITRFSLSAGMHIIELAAISVFAILCAGAGLSVVLLLDRNRTPRWERVFLSIALGWFILGTIHLGLALAGLYYPSLLAIGIILPAIPGTIRLPRLPPTPGKTGALIRPALLFGAPALLAAPFLLLPPVWVDAYIYNLAAPELFLRLHRFASGGRHVGFHLSLTTELLYGLPLAAGLETVVPVIGAIPFFASLGFAAAWAAGIAGPTAAALGTGAVLTTAFILWSILNCISYAPLSGFCLMAAIGQLRRRKISTPLAWGCACGIKNFGLLFAAAGWIWHESIRLFQKRAGWRPEISWPLLALFPVIPWLLKSWLLDGNPVWPMIPNLFPASCWDHESGRSMTALLGSGPDPGGILETFWRTLASNQPFILAAMPLLLLRQPGPLGALAETGLYCAGVHLAIQILAYHGADRYSLPLVTMLCFTVATAVARAWESLGRLSRWAVIAPIWIAFWLNAAGAIRDAGIRPAAGINCLAGSMDLEGYIASATTTLHETQSEAGRLPYVRRLLLVEESRGYGWKRDVMTETVYGRGVPWITTKESRTVERIRIKFRQAGVTHLVFNFITETFPQQFAEVFEWTDRQLSLWHDFMKTSATITALPHHCDHKNGGFYIYRIAPRETPDPFLHYLPGIHSLRTTVYKPSITRGDHLESLERARTWATALPDVAVFRMDAGYFYAMLGDWKSAYRAYGPAIKAGAVNDFSYAWFGWAAVKTGRLEEGIAALEKAFECYTDQRKTTAEHLAYAYAVMADRCLKPPLRLRDALAWSNKSIRTDPGSLAGARTMFLSLIGLSRLDEAERFYEAFRREAGADSKKTALATAMKSRLDNIAYPARRASLK